jgi:hypothetical protein
VLFLKIIFLKNKNFKFQISGLSLLRSEICWCCWPVYDREAHVNQIEGVYMTRSLRLRVVQDQFSGRPCTNVSFRAALFQRLYSCASLQSDIIVTYLRALVQFVEFGNFVLFVCKFVLSLEIFTGANQ